MTLWTVARQAPLSIVFPRQEYWSRLPFPPSGDLPGPRVELASPALASGLFTTKHRGRPLFYICGKSFYAKKQSKTKKTLDKNLKLYAFYSLSQLKFCNQVLFILTIIIISSMREQLKLYPSYIKIIYDGKKDKKKVAYPIIQSD